MVLDLQCHILEFMDLGDVLASTSTCRRWRHAICSVSSIKLTRAAHANAKALSLFVSAKYLLANVLDADSDGPPTDDQYNFAGCIPFALTALPALTNVTLDDWDTNGNGSHEDVSACGVSLMKHLCFARRSGLLCSLCHIEHGCHICAISVLETKARRIAEGHTHIDPAEIDDDAMDDARERCICQHLLRSMPARNKLEYLYEHGLCGTLTSRTTQALRDGTAAALLNVQHESCSDPRRRPSFAIFDLLCDNGYRSLPDREHGGWTGPPDACFTYFDAVLLGSYGQDGVGAHDFVEAINLLVDAGGVVSEGVRAFASSGLLAGELRRNRGFRRWELPRGALVEWIVGPGGNAHLGPDQRHLDTSLASGERVQPEIWENSEGESEDEGSEEESEEASEADEDEGEV